MSRLGTEFNGFFARKKPLNSVPNRLKVALTRLWGRATISDTYFPVTPLHEGIRFFL